MVQIHKKYPETVPFLNKKICTYVQNNIHSPVTFSGIFLKEKTLLEFEKKTSFKFDNKTKLFSDSFDAAFPCQCNTACQSHRKGPLSQYI